MMVLMSIKTTSLLNSHLLSRNAQVQLITYVLFHLMVRVTVHTQLYDFEGQITPVHMGN